MAQIGHQIVKLSVIIPTYNRSRTLIQALRSLQSQSLPDFQILVVDNAADAAVEKAVAEFNVTAKTRVQYVSEPQLGLHNARHTGARAAAGDILVFTDDDATFEPDWLKAYETAFVEHPEMVAAGGPVHAAWDEDPPEWLRRYMGDSPDFGILSLRSGTTSFLMSPEITFFGTNMAIRRHTLFSHRGFNPESFGLAWLGDGETGLWRKLSQARLLMGYVPEALVYHHIPRERMTLRYFRRRMANEGACDIYARYHRYYQGRRVFVEDAWATCRRNVGLWVRALGQRDRTERVSIDVQLQAARTFSQFRYLVRLCRDRQLRALLVKEDWLTETPTQR